MNKNKTIKILNKYKYHNSFIFSDIPNLDFISNYQRLYPINIIDNIIFLNFWIPDVNVAELYCNFI